MLDDFESIAGEIYEPSWIIRKQTDFAQAQIAHDLCPDPVLPKLLKSGTRHGARSRRVVVTIRSGGSR